MKEILLWFLVFAESTIAFASTNSVFFIVKECPRNPGNDFRACKELINQKVDLKFQRPPAILEKGESEKFAMKKSIFNGIEFVLLAWEDKAQDGMFKTLSVQANDKNRKNLAYSEFLYSTNSRNYFRFPLITEGDRTYSIEVRN